MRTTAGPAVWTAVVTKEVEVRGELWGGVGREGVRGGADREGGVEIVVVKREGRGTMRRRRAATEEYLARRMERAIGESLGGEGGSGGGNVVLRVRAKRVLEEPHKWGGKGWVDKGGATRMCEHTRLLAGLILVGLGCRTRSVRVALSARFSSTSHLLTCCLLLLQLLLCLVPLRGMTQW